MTIWAPDVLRVGLLALWATAVLAGLPMVFNDDAYMALPAFEFAAGHGLRAPALAAQFPEFHENFLVYPPGFTVGLGWWVAAFGHSTRSLAVFAALSGLACGRLLFLVLRHLAPGTPLPWCAGLIVVPAILLQGMRPELLGYPLFLLACWLLLARAGSAAGVAAGLSLGLACICAPTLLAPALALMAAHLWALRAGAWRMALAALMAGGALSFAALLWMIDFQLAEQLRQFTAHALERRTAPGLDTASLYYLALLLAGGLLLALGRRRPNALDGLLAWLMAALLLALLSHARQTLSVSLTNLMLLVMAWRLGSLLPWPGAGRWLARLALGGLVAGLVLANLYVLAMVRHQRFPPGDAARLAGFIAATPPGERLLLSPLLLRTLLDGQWPAGALDLYFLRPWREGHLPEGMGDFRPADRVAMTDLDIRSIIAQAGLRAGDSAAYMAPLRDGSGATEARLPSLALRLLTPVLHGLPPRLPLRLCLLPGVDPALAGLPAARAIPLACGGG